MTIKQLHEIMSTDQELYIGHDASLQKLNRENPLEMQAYGNYLVAEISAIDENKIEAELLIQFAKECNT